MRCFSAAECRRVKRWHLVPEEPSVLEMTAWMSSTVLEMLQMTNVLEAVEDRVEESECRHGWLSRQGAGI